MSEAEIVDTKHADAELDASGLYCPLPVLRAKKALDQMSENAILKLIATDPGSEKDIKVYTQQAGYRLVDTAHTSDKFVFFIEKSIR